MPILDMIFSTPLPRALMRFATALAGVIKMKEAGALDPDERIVALVTGHGLKDVDSAMKAVETSPILVEPDIEDIAAKLEM